MTSYYQTPNQMIPLNDRAPGEIAEIAWQQLAPYQEAAKHWPIQQLFRDGRDCNVCVKCDENIYFSTDAHGYEYDYEPDQLLALIVAHIRQVHSGEIGDQETATRSEMSLPIVQE